MRDAQLLVKFFNRAVWNPDTESDQEKLMIEKRIRGQMLEAHVGYPTDQDIQDYDIEYEAFQRREKVVDSGTDLSVMGLHRSRVEMLNKLNVFTIEQLANVTDNILPNFGTGARQIRDSAKEFILSGKAVSGDYQKQIDDLTEIVKELRAENRKLKAKKLPKKKFVLSEDHKRKMADGRERKRQEKLNESATTG